MELFQDRSYIIMIRVKLCRGKNCTVETSNTALKYSSFISTYSYLSSIITKDFKRYRTFRYNKFKKEK